jgi:hypothetical protein
MSADRALSISAPGVIDERIRIRKATSERTKTKMSEESKRVEIRVDGE